MKFIVDAQLPKSLSSLLVSKGFDSVHTLDLPEGNKVSDNKIRAISVLEDRVVITKDKDFLIPHLIIQEPKKLVIVKTGNIPNSALLVIFDKNIDTIISNLESSSLIEIHKNEIVTHS